MELKSDKHFPLYRTFSVRRNGRHLRGVGLKKGTLVPISNIISVDKLQSLREVTPLEPLGKVVNDLKAKKMDVTRDSRSVGNIVSMFDALLIGLNDSDRAIALLIAEEYDLVEIEEFLGVSAREIERVKGYLQEQLREELVAA